MTRCCPVDTTVFGHQWNCRLGLGPATAQPGWYGTRILPGPYADHARLDALYAVPMRQPARI
jgi:hypothetical protein